MLLACRHLTWQRNYNTQPRILSAAQSRLVRTVSEAHGGTSGEAQEWVRCCAPLPLCHSALACALLCQSGCQSSLGRAQWQSELSIVLTQHASRLLLAVQARLMLATVGRGGDGQKIRDEILNIMHRNKISEKKGANHPSWPFALIF
jgi:alpha-glucan, water dikinase